MQTDAIQQVLEEAVGTLGLPCVTGAVTNADATLFELSAGTTELGGAQKVTPDTLFWIASMTKPVTSLAALQLVEQGKLSLDAPIGEVLPELADRQVLENGRLRPAMKKITLRHLLTHTAGFGYDFSNAELAAWLKANGIAHPRGSLAGLDMPLLFEPGTRWEYGISTDWVGRAVEAASGESLDAYFRNHITGPLGMADTGFVPNPAQRERLAMLYQRREDGSLAALGQGPGPSEFFSGGGGLFSTLRDYLKFTRLFLNNGAGLIQPETLQAMSVNQIGPLRAGVFSGPEGSILKNIEVFPGMDAKWSLAFIINPEPTPFGRSPGSLAWSGAANTFFWIDPVKQIAAVLLMQLLPAGDLAVMQTCFGFEREVYAALP